MRKLYRSAVFIAVSLEMSWAISALALDDAELSSAVNQAKIVPNQVVVRKVGTTANFSVYRSPSATAKDCKIDAVLIARRIMKADPKVLVVQGTYFKTSDQTYRGTIEVHASDVKSFASGGSATVLLDTLQFHDWSNAGSSVGDDYASITNFKVKAGAQNPARVAIQAQIEYLSSKGCDVRSYWHEFLDLDKNLEHLPDAAVYKEVSKMTTELKAMQDRFTLEAQRKEGSRTDLFPSPGLSYNRRARIVSVINTRAKSGANVYDMRSHYVEAENYARLGQQAKLDVALDRLEDDLSLSHYTGQ